MDIAPRFRLPSSRLPLVTLAVAVALLATLTGASNSPPNGQDARQALTVGLAADDHDQPAGKAATTTSSVGSVGRPQEPATTTSSPVIDPAAAAGVPGEDGETADTEAASDAGSGEPEPAPTRTRAAAPAPTSPPPPPPVPVPVGLTRLSNVELEVLTLTNLDRGDHGAPPVTRDGCLDGEASAWAYAMAESNVMAHSDGGGPAVRACRGASAAWGDNIGYWQPCFASEMEAWWMGSPSHRPHILDPSFNAVGIGVWAEPSGRCWFQVYFGT